MINSIIGSLQLKFHSLRMTILSFSCWKGRLGLYRSCFSDNHFTSAIFPNDRFSLQQSIQQPHYRHGIDKTTFRWCVRRPLVEVGYFDNGHGSVVLIINIRIDNFKLSALFHSSFWKAKWTFRVDSPRFRLREFFSWLSGAHCQSVAVELSLS